MLSKSFKTITKNLEPKADAPKAEPNNPQPEPMVNAEDDPNARPIIMSDGQLTWVSVEDYEWSSNYLWGHNLWHTNDGYARRYGYLNGKQMNLLLHREVMNFPTGFQVDHINHKTLDNRRLNLRVVTKSQNMANAIKTTIPRSSRYKGVCWDRRRNKWRANIMRNRILFYLGDWDTEIEAAHAYNAKALEISAEHSSLNPI